MPIYEYRCHNCQHQFEELVDFSEDPPDCPACNSNQVSRLLSTPSFSLKGDGWFSDHYGLKETDTHTNESEGTKVESKNQAESPKEE